MDVSEFFPDVVKLVIASNVELKHYVYLYLTHYCDYDESCRENALLSVNTFQQDMSGKNPVAAVRPLHSRESAPRRCV